jgi:phosphoribosyl-ATP pyrophosphohydrolase
MNNSSTGLENTDPIHQLEDDLKRVCENPSRFPRTSKLVSAGAPQQAKKIVEEAAELAIEAMRHDKEAAVIEAADLVYNLVVLLEGMDIRFDDVCGELERRRRIYGIAAKQHKNGIGPADPSDA